MRNKRPGFYWYWYKGASSWTIVEVDAKQQVWFLGNEVEVSMSEAMFKGRFGTQVKR